MNLNPFNRKGPVEKLGDSLGDAVQKVPKALTSVPVPGKPGVAALGGVAALAAASAALSSLRRRRGDDQDGDA